MATQDTPELVPAQGSPPRLDKQSRNDGSATSKKNADETKSQKRRVFAFIAAVFAFALVNVVLAKAKIGVNSPTDFPYSTWSSTAIEDYLSNSNGRPQIALLGSSLMLNPLGAVDADYKREPIDEPYHHKSEYLQDKLKKLTGMSVSTFNFAIPGEMPSDAYFISKFLFKGEKRPDVIVYGVGPRDFMDNLLPNPMVTDPFEHIARLGDVSDHLNLLAPDWQDQLNFKLGRWIFAYGHKADLSCDIQRLCTNALVPHLPAETPLEEMEYRKMILPDFHGFEVRPKACKVRPTTQWTAHNFNDNTEEYKNRYHQLKWEIFLTQFRFFGETLDLARERNIHTIVVSMPVTQRNRDLIPNGAWQLYKQSLRVMAKTKGATYIDLEATKDFDSSDFGDTVHLNSAGGQKMLSMLAQYVSDDKKAIAAITPKHFQRDDILPAPKMVAGLKEHRL
ncbi:MAG TPA: SGNH/GDSL hydrolase family protein [Trichormus sp.]